MWVLLFLYEYVPMLLIIFIFSLQQYVPSVPFQMLHLVTAQHGGGCCGGEHEPLVVMWS